MSVQHSGSVSFMVRTAVALSAIAMAATAYPLWAADASGTTGGDSSTSSQPQLLAQATTPAPSARSTASAATTATLQEVTVTGTRIRRADLQAISPLVTVTADQITTRAGLNVESYLNQLPNFNPAQTPVTRSFDVQPSASNSIGISTISIRGLGANRGLVLINGHRTVPVNADMVTDINGIPAAMISSIQVVTGGASAVYGADALAGVTNFILKKNFEGAQIDVQDGETQAGDGNELEVSGIMGTNFANGRGNVTMDLEYYNRDGSFQRNRDYFTKAWTDPNAPQTDSNALFVQGYNGYFNFLPFSVASNAALAVSFPNRGVSPTGAPLVYGYPQSGTFSTLSFQPGGGLWDQTGPLSTSNYNGPTSGPLGYGLANSYDGTYPNSTFNPAPPETQTLKWNNPLAYVEAPQTRYSFYMNGHYDLTDEVQFYATARYAQSRTATILPTPTTAIFGWEANIPFNAATDSPINPALINNTTSQALLQGIYNSFKSNPTSSNPNWNPGFIGPGATGAQHPVPWQLALLLDSRGVNGVPPLAFLGPGFGGAPTCYPEISSSLCSTTGPNAAHSSWQLSYLPQYGAPQRATNNLTQEWQIEAGFTFPLHLADWTADLYYSRGESMVYTQGLGNDSLQRFRAIIQSPDYGAGESFQGNANGANPNFGTSVPSTCTSGFYNAIFGADVAPSADCQNAIGVTLQSVTEMQQDIAEADFNGSLFHDWAGTISAALGFQYRRDAGLFQPDELQSTSSFLDQTIGLYPEAGQTQPEIAAKDGYGEFFIPLVSNLKALQKLVLDVGGRYSAFADTPNATTFKVDLDAQITHSFRLRGGFNRATRSPDLAELYLGEQEYFGFGPAFGDPCSLHSLAPFGAGGAAADLSPSGNLPGGGHVTWPVASGQTLAGARSTYLICQAQMGGATSPGAVDFYQSTAQTTSNGVAGFGWLNETGNANLHPETANTWTAGFVFSNLGDNAWIRGLSGSVDWWQYNIQNAIELESPDNANYLCYGTANVTSVAAAEAQAATPACQNVGRLVSNGTASTTLLQYTNQATIGIQGIDVELNWIAQLGDLGLKVPGAIGFQTLDSFLDYYRTKQSPGSFDVNTNWKDSLGPTLAGTDPGAYGYRLNTTISYVLPSFSVNLHWIFLPSVNSASQAVQQSIIANNENVAATGRGTMLSYTPSTSIAAPAWSTFDLSFSWNVSHVLQLRGGIENLFGVDPANTGRSSGYPAGTNLNAVCSAAAAAKGCVNPSAYSLPNDGGSMTNTGFYEEGLLGRTFFLGLRASF